MKLKWYVIEFNVRMGDPEAQVILPLLKSSFFDLLWNATEGLLQKTDVKISSKTAVTVVLAADGYPGTYEKGSIPLYRCICAKPTVFI